MGSFNNHVDKILTIFDPLPPSHGQTWTFQWPPTYVHMDFHDHPPLGFAFLEIRHDLGQLNKTSDYFLKETKYFL